MKRCSFHERKALPAGRWSFAVPCLCGHRFSWPSVWDPVRLPRPLEHRLLEPFVPRVSPRRQRLRGQASAPARERFNRLLRACRVQVENAGEAVRWRRWGEVGTTSAGSCFDHDVEGVTEGRRCCGSRMLVAQPIWNDLPLPLPAAGSSPKVIP